MLRNFHNRKCFAFLQATYMSPDLLYLEKGTLIDVITKTTDQTQYKKALLKFQVYTAVTEVSNVIRLRKTIGHKLTHLLLAG